jgi:hypothetical protein
LLFIIEKVEFKYVFSFRILCPIHLCLRDLAQIEKLLFIRLHHVCEPVILECDQILAYLQRFLSKGVRLQANISVLINLILNRIRSEIISLKILCYSSHSKGYVLHQFDTFLPWSALQMRLLLLQVSTDGTLDQQKIQFR